MGHVNALMKVSTNCSGHGGKELKYHGARPGHTRALDRWGGKLGGGKDKPGAWLGTPEIQQADYSDPVSVFCNESLTVLPGVPLRKKRAVRAERRKLSFYCDTLGLKGAAPRGGRQSLEWK